MMMNEDPAITVAGSVPGETITVWALGDGQFRVQRHHPKLGPCTPVVTALPWFYAYSLEAALTIVSFATSVSH